MAKLILSFEGTVQKTVTLNKERITLGRRPDNDIQVDNLAVSGEHAVVVTVLNDSVLEDLNSTNGTLVNGQLIKKHLLQHNDIIELGKHKIKFLVETPTAAGFQNFDKTMVIRRPNTATAAEEEPTTIAFMPPKHAQAAPAKPANVAPAAPSAPIRAAAIQVLSGPAAGRVLDLTKNLTTIGKAGFQVAVITRRPAGYFITHVEGDSFPLFNGAPLGAQARQLSDQDTIEIAGTKMSFFYKPAL